MKPFLNRIMSIFSYTTTTIKPIETKQKVEFNPPIIKATVNNSKYMSKTKFNHKKT